MLYGAPDSQKAAAALAGHNRAVHLLDDWMRDPYIVLAPDGWCVLRLEDGAWVWYHQ